MKTIETIEQEILAEFEALPDVDAKFMHLFEIGQELPPLPETLKTDGNRVRGCQSDLWFNLYETNGRLHLQAESDSMLINSIAALLTRLVEGRTPAEVAEINFDFLDALEIWKMPSKRNSALVAMLDHIHAIAKELT
jgi:cysteine desulfuration protein SufE